MHNLRRLSPPPRGPRIHTRQLSDSPASQFSDRINNFIIAKNPADIVSKFDSSKRKTDIENIEITEKDFSLNKMRNEFRTLASTVSRSLKQKDSSSFRRVDSDIFSTLLPFSSMEFQNDSFFRNKIISNENSEDEDLKTNYVSSVNSNKNILNNENVDKNAKQTNFQNHQINSFQIDNKQNEIEIETSSSTSIYSDTVPYRPCQTPFAVNHTEIDCFPENNQKDEHNSKLYLKTQSPNPKKLNTPNDSIHNDSIHSDSIHSDSIHNDSIHNDSIHSDSIHIALIAEDHSNAEENDFIFELFPYFKNISRKKVVKLDEKIFNDFENENETNKNKFIFHEPRYKEKGKFIIKSSELFVTPPQYQINNDNTEFTHQQQNFHSNPNDEEVEIVRGKLKGEEKSKESAIKKENTMSLTEKEIDENEQSYNTSQECELSDNAPLINKISSQNIKNQKKNESSSFSLEYDEFIDVLTNTKKEAKKRHNDFESDKKISKSNIKEPGSNNENPDEENNLKDLYLNTKNNESNVFDQRNIHSHNNKKTISIHEHSIPTNFPNNTDQKINFKQFPFERQLGNKQESEQGSYDNNSPQNNENASNSKAYNYDHYRNQKLPMVMLSTSSFQVGEDFRSNKEDITDYDISSNTSTPFHDESPLIEEEENFTEGENNTESNKGQKEKHLLENNVFTFPIPPSFLCNQLFPKTIRNPIKITAKYEDPQKNNKFIFIHNDNENQVKSETTLETNGNYENQEKSRGTFLMAKSRYFDDFDGVLRFIKTEHPEFSEEPPFQDINVGYIRSLLWINNTSNLISDPSQDSSAISLVVNNVISDVDNINNEGQINRTLIHEESLKEMPRERNTDTHLQSYESEKSNISEYFTDFEFEYKRRKTPLVLSISLTNVFNQDEDSKAFLKLKQSPLQDFQKGEQETNLDNYFESNLVWESINFYNQNACFINNPNEKMKEDELICPVLFSTHSKFYKIIDKNSKFIPKLKLNFPKSQMELEIEEKCIENDFYLDCIEKIKQTDLFLVTNHNNSYHNKLSRRFFIQISVKQFCIKQGVYLFQKETFLSDSYGNKKYSIKESNFIIGIKDNHIKENNYFADIKDKYITNNKDFLVNIGSISVISGQFQISKIHHQITPENIMIINSKVFHSLKYWLNNKKTNIIGNLQYNLKESFEDFSPESNSIKTREEPKISQNSNYYYNNYKNHDCLTPDELSVENSYFCITSKDNCQEFCYSNNFVTKFDHNEPEYHIDSQINHSKFLVESFLFEIKKLIIKVNDFKVIRSNLCNFDINCKMINLNSKLSDPIFSIIDHDNSFVNTNDKCSILEPELHKNNFPNYLSETFVHYYDINESAFFKPFSSFYLQENIKTIEGLNANLYKNSSKFPHCESAYNIFETSEFGFPNNSDLPLLLDEPETKNVGNYQIADSFILENKLNNKYIIISSNFKNSELIKALIPHDQFSNINFENPNLPKSDENHNTLTRCSSYNIKSSNFKIHVSSLSNLFNYEAKISKQNHFYISNNKYKITHNDFYSLNLNDSKVYNNDFCIKLNRNKITKSDFLPTITSESKEINLNNHNVIQNSDDKVIENCCIHKNDFLMDPMKGSCDDKEFIHSPIQNKIHDQKYSSIIIDCTEKIASFLVLFSIKKEEQISDYNFKVSEEPSNDKKITSTKEDSFFIDSKNRDFSEEKAKLEKETKFEEEINMDLINKSNSKTIDIMETKYTKANGLINYSFDNNSLLSEEENYEQESPLENDSFILNEVFLTPELSSIKDESDTKIYEKEEELINKTNRIYENTEFLSSEFHDDIKEKQKQLQYKVKKTSEMLPILEQNSNNEKKDFFIFESFPIFEEEEESVSKLKTTKKDEKKKATHHKHRSKKTEPKVSSHKHRHMKISSTQKKKEKLEKIENSENSDKYKMQLGILKDHQKNKNQTKRKKKVDFSNSVKPKTLKSISEERLKLTKIKGYLNNLSDSRLTSEFNEEMQLSAFGSDDGINPKNIELNKNCPINYKMFYQSLAFPLLLENKHVNGFVEQIYQSFGNKVRISELFSLIDQSFLHEKELSPLNEESILENPLVSGELLMKKGRLKKEKVHCNLFLNHSFEINQNEIIEKCIIYFDESKKILSVKSNSSSKILEFIQENNKTNNNNKTDKNDKSEIPCGLSKWIFGYHKLCEKDIFAEYLSILVNGLEITNQNIVDCITGPDLQLCLYLLNHKNFPLKLSKNIFLIFISQKRLNFLLRTLFLAEVSTTSYELLFQKNTIYSKPLLILFTATAYEWIISLATKIHNSKNTISSSNFLNFILKEIQYMSAESLCILRAILILSVLVYSDNLISFRIFLSFLKSSIMSVFSVKSLPNKEFILSLFSQIYIQSGDIQGKFFETLTKFNARILMKVPPLSKKIEPRLIENTCKNVYEFVQENSADFVTFLEEKTKKSNNEKHPILFSFFHNLRFLLYSKYGINLPIHD